MKRDYEKISGSLLGGAAGDALGYAIEFDSEDYIFRHYGKNGIREYELDDGKARFSDDTQMTLYTAEGIVTAKNPMEYSSYIQGVYDAYEEWLRTQDGWNRKKKKLWLSSIDAMNNRRAPGNTCLSALREKEVGSISEPLNNSKGCGGVMRVAPVGLFYSPDEMEPGQIDYRAAQAAALTHGHPLGYIPAAGLAHIINLAVYRPEMSMKEIVQDMIGKVPAIFTEDAPFDCAAFKKLMEKALKLAGSGRPDLECIHELGEGWVGEEALAIAVYCAVKYADNFEAGLVASVNHKGDSDSTGSVTGNILGAYLGVNAIPEKFKNNLEMTDVIQRVARELAEK